MTLVIRCPSSYEPERRYAIDVVLGDFLGLDYFFELHDRSSVTISDARRETGLVIQIDDRLFATPAEDWLTTTALPREPLPRRVLPEHWQNDFAVHRTVPVLYHDSSSQHSIAAVQSGRVDLHFDLFGSVFFLLTRYEEVVSRVRDVHGRFPASASLMHRERLLQRPLVNEYVEILWRAMKSLWPRLERRYRAYRLIVSHDVDRPLMHEVDSHWRHALRGAWEDLRYRRNLPLAAERIRSFHQTRRTGVHADPYHTFRFLMQTSESNGVRSAFYFPMGGTHADFDPQPALPPGYIDDLVAEIAARDHEIGFHPSYDAATNHEQFIEECDHFRSILKRHDLDDHSFGGRQHFLRWSNPDSWRQWSEIGASYDATVGFADDVGFRAGVCCDYPVFDLERRCALPLREQPLVVMDSTLFQYLGLSPHEAFDTVADLREVCFRYAGDLTLLVHNSSLPLQSQRRWYEEVIRHAA